MSVLVSCLANVILRRSKRLQDRYETRYIMTADRPLGYFSLLPLELKFLVFKYLTVEDLSLLTITSKSLRQLTELYRNYKGAPQFRKIREVKHGSILSYQQKVYEAEFRKLGIYMKRSTCLYTTKERLQLMQQFLQKCLCRFCVNCLKPTKCRVLSCFGIFLRTLIAGWDDSECIKTFNFIMESAHVLKCLNTILQHGAGLLVTQELHVRLFLRHVFIDHCKSKTEKAFWLDLILKPYPPKQQARILFLLFGMMYGEVILWFSLNIETDIKQSERSFNELARTLKLLCHDWSEDGIINIIDNMTDDWCSTNQAVLLHQCGKLITFKVLTRKVQKGSIKELAVVVTSLCLIKWHYCGSVNWVMDIIQSVCEGLNNQNDRIKVIYEIIDAFKLMVGGFYDLAILDDDTSTDFHNLINAQAAFSRELALLALK